MLNYIIIFLISMVPLVELRGALIYSQAIGMPLLASYIIVFFISMVPLIELREKIKNILENSLLFV